MYQNASPLAATLPNPVAIPPNPILGVQIGADSSDNFALSISGLAIKRADGRFVAKPSGNDRLLDVTAFLIPGIDPMVYRLPVTHLLPGDLIVVSDDPLTLRYVLEEDEDGELEVLDPDTGDVTEYVPVQAPIFNFFVRVVSVFDFLPDLDLSGGFPAGNLNFEEHAAWFRKAGTEGAKMGEQRERSEFDELLLLSLLGQSGGAGISNILPLLLLSQVLGRGDSGGILPLLLLSGAFQPGATTTTPTVPPPAGQPLPLNLLLLFALLGRKRRRPSSSEEEKDQD